MVFQLFPSSGDNDPASMLESHGVGISQEYSEIVALIRVASHICGETVVTRIFHAPAGEKRKDPMQEFLLFADAA